MDTEYWMINFKLQLLPTDVENYILFFPLANLTHLPCFLRSFQMFYNILFCIVIFYILKFKHPKYTTTTQQIIWHIGLGLLSIPPLLNFLSDSLMCWLLLIMFNGTIQTNVNMFGVVMCRRSIWLKVPSNSILSPYIYFLHRLLMSNQALAILSGFFFRVACPEVLS